MSVGRAAMWFENVEQFDKDLREFDLAESVRKVSQPPKSERYRDRWNNVKLSQPKPGDYFNRRTCSWYVDSKKKDIVLLQGLCAFAKEDYAKAKEHWDKLSELDKEFYTQQKADGWENATVHYRLTQRIKYQPGALFATPSEMACFKDKQRRLAVLLADMYYIAERPDLALRQYRWFEKGRWGTLSYNEKAYICFAIFSCMCWDKDADEVAFLQPKLRAFAGTPSEVRAVFGFANRLNTGQNKELLDMKIKAYEYVIQKFPESEEAGYAVYVLGLMYADAAQEFQKQNNASGVLTCLQKTHKLYSDWKPKESVVSYRADMEKIITKIDAALVEGRF